MLVRSNIEKLPLKRCKAGIVEKHVKWNFWSQKVYMDKLKTKSDGINLIQRKNNDDKLQN